VHGFWPVAAAQAEVAAANAVGDVRRYEPPPAVTILKGIGIPVTSIGDVEGTAETEELAWESSEDEIRYRKLVLRDERLDGAVLMGRWPETQSVLDAVASHAEVAGVLERLPAGDLIALTAG